MKAPMLDNGQKAQENHVPLHKKPVLEKKPGTANDRQELHVSGGVYFNYGF